MKSNINEGNYRGDLQRLLEPQIHIDQHTSKMGNDDDTIVCSFKVKGKEPATDLMSFLETGYSFILDADVSPGEFSPGKFLVFFELPRRSKAAAQIYSIIEEVLNLSLQEMSEWTFSYGKVQIRGSRRRVTTHPVTLENLERMIPLSPRTYRDTQETAKHDSDDIAAMKNIAGIPVNQTAPDDNEMQALKQMSGQI